MRLIIMAYNENVNTTASNKWVNDDKNDKPFQNTFAKYVKFFEMSSLNEEFR